MRPASPERRRRGRCYVLLGMFVSATFACGTTDELEVGVALRQDGRDAALVAAQDIGKSGGVHGRPLRLQAFSSAMGAASVVLAERLATNSKIVAVVGHSSSATTLAAAQVYNEYGLPHVAPWAIATMLSAAGPYSFRLVPGDDRQADILAEQAARFGRSVRTAILYENDDYGRGLHALLIERLNRLQITPVYDTPFLASEDTSRFASLAESIGRAAPDLLFWLGRSIELGIFLPLLRPHLQDLLVIGSDGVENARVYRNDGGRYTGVRFVRFVDPRSPDGRVAEVRRKFKETAGQELTTLGLLTYDAVGLLAEALRSGARTREDVRDYLNSLGRTRPPYDGVAGPIEFDENGDAVRRPLLAEVTPAGVRAVQPEEPQVNGHPRPESRETGDGGLW